MASPQGFYNYESRLRNVLERIREDKKLTPASKRLLLDYSVSLKNLQLPTQGKVMQSVYAVALMLNKDFKKATRRDVDKLVASIHDNQKWTPATKEKFLVDLKRFYSWAYSMAKGQYPKQCAHIRVKSSKQRNGTLPEELLTPEDIKKMLKVTQHPRDAALISLLFDSGCRIGEVAGVQIKHIEDKGTHLEVLHQFGKNGSHKTVSINAKPYLLRWLEVHPKKHGKDSYVFVSFAKSTLEGRAEKIMCQAAMAKVLRVVAKRAGIEKPVNPHHFRHSVVSLYSRHFKNALVLREWFTWSKAKDIASNYIHLSCRDMLEEYLRWYKSPENILRVITCTKCGEVNEGAHEFCAKCSAALLPETILSKDEKQELLKEGLRGKSAEFKDKLWAAKVEELERQLNELKAVAMARA